MKSDPSNPLCYSCKFRGNVPGSAHSTCLKATNADVLYFIAGNSSLGIKGTRNDWFIWPLDFDPVWLENCEGYENKDDIRKT